MSDTPIKDVSDTAFMVAMYRALEGRRADALFHDPLTLKLAGEHGKKIIAGIDNKQTSATHADMMIWTMAIRTYVIDRLISEAVSQGVEAVLNLGAGLDTRPYRMSLPSSLHWIEVDYAHVIELKDARLADEQPHCRLERVKMDLSQVEARRIFFGAINERFGNVLVLTEGVVPYLSNDDAGQLADDLRAQPAFKHWIVDYFSPFVLQWRKKTAIARRMENAPFKFEPADYYDFFAQHGWKKKDVRYLPEEARKVNRPVPVSAFAKIKYVLMSPFLSKKRRMEMARFMAYVVFEPG